MNPQAQQHAEAAAAAASATSAAYVGTKLTGIWSAVALSFVNNPAGFIAAVAATLYSLHLVLGWWLDRLGISLIVARRKGRKP